MEKIHTPENHAITGVSEHERERQNLESYTEFLKRYARFIDLCQEGLDTMEKVRCFFTVAKQVIRSLEEIVVLVGNYRNNWEQVPESLIERYSVVTLLALKTGSKPFRGRNVEGERGTIYDLDVRISGYLAEAEELKALKRGFARVVRDLHRSGFGEWYASYSLGKGRRDLLYSKGMEPSENPAGCVGLGGFADPKTEETTVYLLQPTKSGDRVIFTPSISSPLRGLELEFHFDMLDPHRPVDADSARLSVFSYDKEIFDERAGWEDGEDGHHDQDIALEALSTIEYSDPLARFVDEIDQSTNLPVVTDALREEFELRILPTFWKEFDSPDLTFVNSEGYIPVRLSGPKMEPETFGMIQLTEGYPIA